MATVYDVNGQKLVEEVAKKLKEMNIEVKFPKWINMVKTSKAHERIPEQDDWYYYRIASILRQVYINGPVGVSKLRRKYGRRRKKTSRGKSIKGAGNNIRKALQILEELGFVKKSEKGKKGRVITDKGKSFLDKIATEILREG